MKSIEDNLRFIASSLDADFVDQKVLSIIVLTFNSKSEFDFISSKLSGDLPFWSSGVLKCKAYFHYKQLVLSPNGLQSSKA